MKKTIFSIMALAMAMVSCTNEEIPTPAEQYGYINVNVSNDPLVENATQTRAEVRDIANWFVMAGDIDLTEGNKVPAGTYTVTAQSHANMAAALEGWGEAYYYGAAEKVEVTAGQTATANINCGKAKNGRITTSFNLAAVFTDVSITVDRNLTFKKENENQKAYFAPGEVSYTLKYKYNGSEEKSIAKAVTVAAGTEHIISVSSNSNGTITVNITYDDTFANGDDQNINFDAATGNQA
jgi:hypothetical protein